MKCFLITLLISLFSFVSFGKKSHEEKLQDLKRANGFDATIGAYINIIKGSVKRMPDSSLFYIDQVEDFAKELNHKLSDDIQSKLKFYRGVGKYHIGKHIEGKHYIEQSIKIPHKDSLDGQRYFYLALNQKKVGNYTQSVENFIRAATIFEKANKQKARVSAFINLSNVLNKTKQYEKSLQYYSEALQLAEKHKLDKLNANIYTGMGDVFLDMEDYQLALDHFNQSYNESKNQKNIYGQFATLINIAGAKRMLGDTADALSHLQNAVLLLDSLNNTALKGKVYYELGDFYAFTKNKKEAEFYLREALKIAKSDKNNPDISQIYKSYRILYENIGDFKKSLKFFKKFEEIKDEITASQNTSKITQINAQFEWNKKEDQLKLMASEREVEEAQNQRNRFFIYLLIGLGALLLVLVLALATISVIRSKKNEVLKEKNEELEDKKGEIESKNHELETFNYKLENTNNALKNKNIEIETQKEKLQLQRDMLNSTHEQLKIRNKDITDSINYAQKIQQAMLNSSFHIDGSGVEYFTFYKPRDIVSGDFYWSNVIGDELIVAIGDCTGHGVPGAFMSCLGISLLNEIVFGREIVQPHNILEELRNSVIQLIATDKNADLQIGDGMDIAVISLNLKTNYLKFSGAMNGLVIVSDSGLVEVKGDKNPIGQHIIPNHKFTLIEKQLKSGDSIFATTDGYKDQFGGPKGKKLGKRRLQEKLSEVSQLSVPVQRAEMIKFYKSWIMDEEQIDDICLFGMKLPS